VAAQPVSWLSSHHICVTLIYQLLQAPPKSHQLHLLSLPEKRYPRAMDLPRQKNAVSVDGFLDDQFLIAMPGMKDDRFARSVIYVCAHSDEGGDSAHGKKFEALHAVI
jgi:hypothetical protein